MTIRKIEYRPKAKGWRFSTPTLPSINDLFLRAGRGARPVAGADSAAQPWLRDYGWLQCNGYDVEDHLPKGVESCVPYVVRCLEEHFNDSLANIDPMELAELHMERTPGKQWVVYKNTHSLSTTIKSRTTRAKQRTNTEEPDMPPKDVRHNDSEKDRRCRLHRLIILQAQLCSDFICRISQQRVQDIKTVQAAEDGQPGKRGSGKPGTRKTGRTTVQALGKDEVHTQGILGSVSGGIVISALMAGYTKLQEDIQQLHEEIGQLRAQTPHEQSVRPFKWEQIPSHTLINPCTDKMEF